MGKPRKGDRDTSVRRCGKTFPEHFDSLYYGRHLAKRRSSYHHSSGSAEGSSLRGISRISGRAYGTVVGLMRAEASESTDDSQSKSQTDRDRTSYCGLQVVIRRKKEKNCLLEELEVGDCWIGVSLASDSGLILTARVGKHTDASIAELVNSTTDKTNCLNWNTDGWGGDRRVLSEEINHQIGKKNTQRLERSNGIIRQQTGRWHRRQNKFAKIGQQTKVRVRLVISYFNWIWVDSRLRTTAAQRAGLTDERWTWNDLATYPTVLAMHDQLCYTQKCLTKLILLRRSRIHSSF